MLLRNARDIDALLAAIKQCKGEVILRSVDGKEEFNMKSTLSQYIAVSRLCEEHGDFYEIFCMERTDEPHLLQFFHEMFSK